MSEFPGILTSKGRINLDKLVYKNPDQFLVFNFNASHTSSKVIGIISKNSVIYQVMCKVEHGFDALNSLLLVGTDEDQNSIAEFNVNTRGFRFGTTFSLPKFGKIFTKDETIRMVVTAQSGVSTRGTGFCIIRYVDLDLIEASRKVGL